MAWGRVVFFFQAEDGIRDVAVTGVQTCALPIWPGPGGAAADGRPAARVPLRQLMDDRLLDALLDRSRDEAGGLRLTGGGAMRRGLVKAGLGAAREARCNREPGYGQGARAGRGRRPGAPPEATPRQNGQAPPGP